MAQILCFIEGGRGGKPIYNYPVLWELNEEIQCCLTPFLHHLYNCAQPP